MPQKHEVSNGGYGEPRENESWCSCGWSVQEDLLGQQALWHWSEGNQPYWEALEKLRDASHRVVREAWPLGSDLYRVRRTDLLCLAGCLEEL